MESLPFPEFAHYEPRRGLAPVIFLNGPLTGLKLYVPKELPGKVRIHGKRHGNHKIWVTHYYVRDGKNYRHLKTDVDRIELPPE